MKKNKYIRPEVSAYTLEAQNMLALSMKNTPADNSAVLTNENDDTFSDIWGN